MVLLVAMCAGCSVFGCGFGGLLIMVFSLLMVLGDVLTGYLMFVWIVCCCVWFADDWLVCVVVVFSYCL